jgi:hypothetical protein
MLGLAVSRTFVQTRAHGADADLAFCRDLTPASTANAPATRSDIAPASATGSNRASSELKGIAA